MWHPPVGLPVERWIGPAGTGPHGPSVPSLDFGGVSSGPLRSAPMTQVAGAFVLVTAFVAIAAAALYAVWRLMREDD